MSTNAGRMAVSIMIFMIWVLITVFGGRILSDGQTSLAGSVSHSIAWNILAAALFLIAAVALFGWKDMHFNAPRPGSLKLLWFPAIYLVAFFSFAIVLGLPPLSVILFVLANTLIVGFSEELMFRGVLYRAFNANFPVWPSILVSCILFGSIHILNMFITGQVLQSTIQSLAATMSGFVFVAILLRTGSIIPAMIYHGIWDFGTFVLGASGPAFKAENPEVAAGFTLMWLLPIAFVLPNFLYGLYLLRNIDRQPSIG